MTSTLASGGVWEYFVRKIAIREPWECWLWKASVSSNGYGNWAHQKHLGTAHRMTYKLFNGDPGPLQINHKCGNRRCCNPDHLYAGTQLENFEDMLRHGTHTPPPYKIGSQVGNSKLCEEQVAEIKRELALGATCTELARVYRVSKSTISLIRRGIRWSHVST